MLGFAEGLGRFSGSGTLSVIGFGFFGALALVLVLGFVVGDASRRVKLAFFLVKDSFCFCKDSLSIKVALSSALSFLI